MTLIQGRGCPCRKHISKKSSPLPELDYNKAPVDSPISLSTPLVAKYTKEDLQKIFRTILEAQASSSDRPYEKQLKARSPEIYYGKSHMECYNFCQQCKDYFAIAGGKSSNYILFATSFLHNCINFH